MKLRIVNLPKFILSSIIIIGIIMGLLLLMTNSSISHTIVSYKSITVSQGDTLWRIAQEQSEENPYYEDKDIRYIVNDIIETNHLDPSNLSIDQKIQIPTI